MEFSPSPQHPELSPDDLRWRCNPDVFEFDSTESLEPLEGILGQERALNAIKLGVDLRSPGYNIYIAGLSGSGKATTVKKILENVSKNCPPLKDYAYVNNFRDQDRPLLLIFPSGKAVKFKREMASAIEILKKRIPQVLENESFTNKRKKIIRQYNEKEQELLASLNEKLQEDNFSLGQVSTEEVARPEIFPVVDEKPVPIQQLDELIQQEKLTKEQAKSIVAKYNEHQQELQSVYKKGVKLSREFQEKLSKLEKDAAGNVIKGTLDNLKETYVGEKIHDYITAAEEHILQNIQAFKGVKSEGEITPAGYVIDYFKEYEVNVILDCSESKECPVIEETSPSFLNVFGTIEKINDGRGGYYTDFTQIKAGSLLRANGGYLVLNVNHLFEEPGVWKMLKRVLTYRKLEIQEFPHFFQISPSTLKPEPIEIDTKIILVGSQQIYSFLANHEYDFKKIFKIKADFDYEIRRNDDILIQYARVIKKLIKEENLCEFDKYALAELIQLAARLAGQKYKLTTRFSKIADLAREASFWATDKNCTVVTAEHVKKAYTAAKERHGLLESKINDMIEDEMLLLDTEGERVGQINGLALYGADFYAFGRPTRITATVSLGSGSIINVEREAGMSGKHYNKGVLIISGYFRETFGQKLPLSFTANLVFEQSYGTVDGDSASCAEIFALLSTLADLPIKQYLAVTGSLNQKGDVQPIGGVNEKIEGFFDLCKSRGLSGSQGVIIPHQNVKELMLKEELVQAVADGKFHIYPIKRVEQGIEILTGVSSGRRIRGRYPRNSVFNLVEKKIKELYAKSKAIKGTKPKPQVKNLNKKENEQ
jgi:lon-related putative ATP-dependent protease